MFILYMSIQGLWKHKKRTLSILFVIFGLTTAILFSNSIGYTNRATKQFAREQQFGSWTYANFDGEILDKNSFDEIGTITLIENEKNLNFGSFDENMLSLSSFQYHSGQAPQNENEIIAEIGALELIDATMEIGQKISIKSNEGVKNYILVGIIFDYSETWVNSEDNNYEYPNIITTNMIGKNISQFAYSEKIPNIAGEQYISNGSSYHQIDTESSMFDAWQEETKLIDLQSKQMSLSLTLVSIFVITSLLNLMSSFYQKKIILLRTLGIEKFEAFIYIMVQALFYMLFVILSFFLSLSLIRALYLLNLNYRFDYSLQNFKMTIFYLSISAFVIYFGVNISSILRPLNSGGIIPSRKSIFLKKIIPIGLTFVLSTLIFTSLSSYFFDLIEYHRPVIVEQKKEYTASKHYSIWGNIGGKTNLLNKEKLLELESRDGVKEVLYYNSYYVSFYTSDKNEELSEIEIISYPDKILDYFIKSGLNLSETFYSGDSVIISNGYIETNDNVLININDTIFLGNDETFIVENIIDSKSFQDVMTKEGTTIPLASILISEKGLTKLGYNPYEYTVIHVRLNEKANILEYDVEMSKLAQGQSLKNQRYYYETQHTKLLNDMNLVLLEMIIVFIIGIGIISNIILNSVLLTKKEIGLQKLLGYENKTIINISQFKLFLPMIISIFPSIFLGYGIYSKASYTRYLELKYDYLAFENFNGYKNLLLQSSLKGSSFYLVIVLFIICIAILLAINYLITKFFVIKNPFELIDERE